MTSLPDPALPLGTDVRRGLELITALILPGTATLPGGTAVGAHAELLDRALSANPRLIAPITAFGRRAAEAGAVSLADLQSWSETDCEEVVFAITASYYMAPEVQRALGYPGQIRRPIAEATPEEKHSDELLAPVLARGPAYVATPELGAS